MKHKKNWSLSLANFQTSFFYPSVCTFILSFLCDASITAVVDGYCSFLKLNKSGVSQGSVLSSTFLMFFLSQTLRPIHSYADDSTLYLSTSFTRRPTKQEVNHSRRDATGNLTSNLYIKSERDKANHVLFSASKTQFLQLLTQHKFPHNYLLYFNGTRSDLLLHLFSK